MKKMPCLFQREFDGPRKATLLRTVTPGCEWVLNGEGQATRKRDGTACAVIDGLLYKRYDAKRGKLAPANAIPCDEPDEVTGHWPHWIPVGDEPESKWHREAYVETLPDGTYELCGPKINGNPEQLTTHCFYSHGTELLSPELTWDGLRDFLFANYMEGIVWHHPDGRMVKLRRKDFGLVWP